MSKSILTNINMNKNQILNGVIQNLASDPSNAVAGQLYYNTVDNLLKQYNGTSWVAVGAPVDYDLELGSLSGNAVPIILSNEEDPEDLSTIYVKGIGDTVITKDGSNIVINTTDTTYTFSGTLNTTTHNYDISITPKGSSTQTISIPANYVNKTGDTMSGTLNMGGNKVTNLGTATNDQDAPTFKQLKDAIAALGTVFNLKGSVATIADLPSTGNKIGDVYYVRSESSGYIWINRGTEASPDVGWEEFGPAIDLTPYLRIDALATSTGTSQSTAMTQKATTDALNLKADKTELTPVYVDISTMGNTLTSKTITVDGTIVNVEVTDSVTKEVVVTDVTYTSDSVVTVNVASAPTNALKIKVLYLD